MPVYIYKCKKCDYIWDALVKNTGKEKTVCPKCDSKDIEKRPVSFSTSAACEKCCGKCGSCGK